MQKNKELVIMVVDFFVIVGQLYMMGSDEFLRRYVPKCERHNVLAKAHGGVT